LIDIDHFKYINDAFGHAQGDDLLVQIAARISSAIRYSDVLIRWGGEEFLVVSRHTNRDEGETLAARVLESVGTEPFQLASGNSIRRTCSIGWAVFPWSPERPEAADYQEILRLADHALYEAKRQGRNRATGLLAAVSRDIDCLRQPDFNHRGAPPCRKVVTPGPQIKSTANLLLPNDSI
jgi:diguanylate cyclase (GGDEF)-like protein